MRSFLQTLLVVSLIIVSLLVLIGWRAGSIYSYEDTFDGAKLLEIDAIVVLAGARGRIAAAGDLWYRYFEVEDLGGQQKTPILYVSGMGPTSSWNTFLTLVRIGVSKAFRPSDVVLETESTNTVENAELFVKNARLRGWKRVLLLTSSYHMKRSQLIFSRILLQQGLQVELKSHTILQEPFSGDEWMESFHGIRVTLIEYMKWIYYSAFWDP